MDRLRTPLFVVALALAAVAVLVELGVSALPTGSQVTPAQIKQIAREQLAGSDLSDEDREDAVGKLAVDLGARDEEPPGLGIPSMAVLDGLVLYTLVLIGLGLVLAERVHGRVQGLATLVVSILALLGAIVLIFVAIGKLFVMLGLFLAAPFGTIAYLALFGFFNRGAAAASLGLLMTLKLAAAVCLVFAHQRFLQNKGLVLIVATSLLANVVVAFLHGLVPLFLVSITDDVAAIVCLILAAIWAIVMLVGSIVSVVKAVA